MVKEGHQYSVTGLYWGLSGNVHGSPGTALITLKARYKAAGPRVLDFRLSLLTCGSDGQCCRTSDKPSKTQGLHSVSVG